MGVDESAGRSSNLMDGEKTMPYTEVQSRIYGCLTEDIDNAVLGSITYRVSQDLSVSRLEVALSMLSDAQEQMARSRPESARQAINRAKYLIDKERYEKSKFSGEV